MRDRHTIHFNYIGQRG